MAEARISVKDRILHFDILYCVIEGYLKRLNVFVKNLFNLTPDTFGRTAASQQLNSNSVSSNDDCDELIKRRKFDSIIANAVGK
ncbi:11612_t:CDS:2 [Ambispora gerdemannii]|uniref:11612_t:CDS:1 n=1 Tax=Ambispora gerdemannii TaxID=144530 RepID=A0A9N8VAV0_9GLOM|nr:11612_t:CDS:2 [Ambispora gerdemannii]